MKVLWLGGIVLPRIAEKENLPVVPVNGWLIKTSEIFVDRTGEKLVYLFETTTSIKGENEYYRYYGISSEKTSTKRMGKKFIDQIIHILQVEKPDIIHIWGTEGARALGVVEACNMLGIIGRVVISIQGLVSKCAIHYQAGLPQKIVKGYTMRDVLKGNIIRQQREFYEWGQLEIEALKKVKHVIGRTEWDKACVLGINPRLKYHFNNETLRDDFYSGMWDYDKCEKYSIFCGQANYPLKGVHSLIEALPQVLQSYPKAHLYIPGKDYFSVPKWKLSSYGRYLMQLIEKNNLFDNISFTGVLDAQKMKQRYLSSNVFVVSSYIENSPNSLGEAMILGVPCISSRVGGIHSMFQDRVDGFMYPANESYMLAYYICEMFRNPEQAKQYGLVAREHAKRTHNQLENIDVLFSIYNCIAKDD